MFRLVVVEGASLSADAGPAEVVIRDRDGTVCAFGWRASADYWLRFPGIGTFRLRPEELEVAVVEGGGLDSPPVLDAYYSAVLPLAYHLIGYEALHASAVLTSAGVVAFCALSETGKSTLAFGLSRRGNSLWTDDVLVFEIGSGQGVACHPVPFTAHLRPQTQAHFGVGHEETTILRSAEHSRLAPFAALLLIEREERSDQPPVESERLPLSKALPAVLPHAFRFTLNDPERKRRMMQSYLDLVARVPVVRVGFVPGFEHIPRVLDGLEEAIRAAVPRLA